MKFLRFNFSLLNYNCLIIIYSLFFCFPIFGQTEKTNVTTKKITVSPSSNQNVTDLGQLSRQSEAAPIYPIAIISSMPDVLQLAQSAFRLHGGYRIVNQQEAAFTFRFTRVGTHKIELIIESGRPAQIQFQQQVLGIDNQQSILKACDLAVQKTLGIPGFFAGKIAFVSERGAWKEIFSGDLFFKKTRQLTHDKHHAVTPHWSPDGQKIVYTTYLSEFPDLYLIDLTTGRRRPFATYQGINTGGAYSPNGSQIAMILSSSGNPELYISPSNGKNPKRLTETKALEASPCWSPDGQKLVFTSDRLGGPQLFEMNIHDRSVRRLPLNLSRYCAEATFNPIPTHPSIAFTAAVSKTFQIGLFDYKTGKARFITEGPGDSIEPCWLSDGRHLIFTRRHKKEERLYILDTVTGKQTPLHGVEFGNASQAQFVYAP